MGKARRFAHREVSAGGVVFRRFPDGGLRFLLIKDSYQNWGFPKGHVETGERPVEAAQREVTEETGLTELVDHGVIEVIDWYFQFRGKLIHKFCHFYLLDSPRGDTTPQHDEGITECEWLPFDAAVERITYDNAREVLIRAGEMVRAREASESAK